MKGDAPRKVKFVMGTTIILLPRLEFDSIKYLTRGPFGILGLSHASVIDVALTCATLKLVGSDGSVNTQSFIKVE